MAIEQHELSAQQQPISELDGYTVEAGDTDPRGWNAIGGAGQRIGRVVDLIVDTDSMKVRKLVVEPDDDTSTEGRRSLLLDLDSVDLRPDSREVVVFGDGLTQTSEGIDTRASDTSGDTVRETLTRSEEELRVGTREVNRGEVRVGKHVRTEHVSQPVTTRREEVVIERRPVIAESGTVAPIGEDEIRIPVMEEEVVVETRQVVKEELVIGKRIIEEQDVVNAEVRREEFEIDDTVDKVTESGTSRRGRE